VFLNSNTITVQNVASKQYGGDILLERLMQYVCQKAGVNLEECKSLTRFRYQAMKKLEAIYAAEEVEFDNLSMLFGCADDSLQVTVAELAPIVDGFLYEIITLLSKTLKTKSNFKIIVSGGMCNLLPFKVWLRTSFGDRVKETFSFGNACVMGTVAWVGYSELKLNDIPLLK